MRHAKLLAAALLTALASPSHGDWLQDAMSAADSALIASDPPGEAPKAAWRPVEYSEFDSELPSMGWYAYEEEDALGTVVRAYGPDSSAGAVRATLSVRLIDRSSPNYLPPKDAVEAMRRQTPGRDSTPVRAMRVAAGLARIFEVTATRREDADDGPSLPEQLHEYVAVIPRGEAYFLVRFISTEESYLNSRDVFARFVKRLTSVGAR